MPMGPGSPPKHYIDSGLTMQDRFVVLRLFTSAAYRPSPGTNFSVPAADCCTRFSKIGLLQKPPARLPTNLTQRLLSEQNAAARLIFRILQSEHITPALISLHWLRVPERIYFKLAVMTFRSIYGTSPSYLYIVFYPCCRHDIQTTAVVFYLPSPGRPARSSFYSRQAGLSGFWCHRLK